MAQACLCAFESWDLVSEHGFLGFRKVGIFLLLIYIYITNLSWCLLTMFGVTMVRFDLEPLIHKISLRCVWVCLSSNNQCLHCVTQVSMLSQYSEAIRGNLSKILRLKIVALVTVEVHARDVISKLAKAGCCDVSAFDWLCQLRLYWDKVRAETG